MSGITVLHILFLLASLFLIAGIWQFLWIVIHKKGYEMNKLDGEKFMDWCFRYYEGEFVWKLRKKFGPKWFYYSKMFFIFMKIKGVLLILAGAGILVGVFLISRTDYAGYLHITI